ncbi:MAG: LysM peptidoglycan-binding domain-containing protein [Rhizobacter sp.]|nr:LysM peptidoglycan-binding domain-containing protein [Bacteriovorax sp.]
MKIITFLALILTLGSCSVSKKEEVAVNHDDLEFAVDTLADAPANTEFKVEEQKVAENIVPDEYQAPVVVEETPMTAPVEPKFGDFKKPEEKVDRFLAETASDSPVVIQANEPVPAAHNSYGPMETYKMQKGDTLMMVSFKIYGDYRKWKDIKSWNKNIKKYHEGVELKYQVPDSKFGWMPSGLPYLVKSGDTLQIISMEKYSTTRKWKSIYNNNRPLIRDPNLIFAGFTIYYQPTRELASEKK